MAPTCCWILYLGFGSMNRLPPWDDLTINSNRACFNSKRFFDPLNSWHTSVVAGSFENFIGLIWECLRFMRSCFLYAFEFYYLFIYLRPARLSHRYNIIYIVSKYINRTPKTCYTDRVSYWLVSVSNRCLSVAENVAFCLLFL